MGPKGVFRMAVPAVENEEELRQVVSNDWGTILRHAEMYGIKTNQKIGRTYATASSRLYLLRY